MIYLDGEQLNNPGFRYRDKEIALVHHQWEQGESLLLTGIRRTGKTEVMRAALYRYQQAGHAVAYLNVEQEETLSRFYEKLLITVLAKSPEDFRHRFARWLETAQQLPAKLIGYLRAMVKTISYEGGGIELRPLGSDELSYWYPIHDKLAELLAKQDRQQLPVIAIDELPFMIENLLATGVTKDDLRIFLASLRSLRSAGLRMVIGGSTSFENLLSLRDISHTVLGGLFRLSIAPFDREQAKTFLREGLAGKFASRDEVIELALNTLPDYLPEALKIAKGYLIGCGDLSACRHSLDNEVMPSVRRSFLQQFRERLDKNYDDQERGCVEQIFDTLALADAQGGLIDTRGLPHFHPRVFNKLQYDNFIEESANGGWRFSLQLIRQWWRNERGIAA